MLQDIDGGGDGDHKARLLDEARVETQPLILESNGSLLEQAVAEPP